MPFRRLRDTSFSLLLLAGTVCVGIAEGSALYSLVVAGAVVLAWLRAGRQDTRSLPGWAVTSFVLGIASVSFLRHLAYEGRSAAIFAICHFLILVHVVRLFGRRRERDYFSMAASCFAMLLVSASTNTSPSFLLGFLLFTVVCTWTLYLHSLVRKAGRPSGARGRQVDAGQTSLELPLSPARLRAVLETGARISLLIAAASLVLAFLLFFIVPRPMGAKGPDGFDPPSESSDDLGESDDRSRRVSPRAATRELFVGFNDEVNLNIFGRAKLSHAPALKVVLEPSQLSAAAGRLFTRSGRYLWRGLAFHEYRRGRWIKPSDGPAINDMDDLKIDGWVTLGEGIRALQSGGPLVRQRITSYLSGVDVLFAMRPVHRFRLDRLRIDQTDGYRTAFPDDGRRGFTYTVESVVAPFDHARLEEAAADRSDPRYLDRRGTPSAVARLAREIAGARRRSPYTKARVIERYLSRPDVGRFTYALDIPRPPRGMDPAEYFLLHRKRGHCGLFATSMVLMLRAADVPARLVNGFSGGDWNAGQNEYIVRQSDAHAWVEIALQGYGWVPFDPTPAESLLRQPPRPRSVQAEAGRLPAKKPQKHSRLGPSRRRGRYSPLVRGWNHYIVGFDAGSQRTMYRNLGGALSGLLRTDPGGDEGDWGPAFGVTVVVAGFLTILVIILLLTGRLGRRKGAARRDGPQKAAAERFYREMLRLLVRRGFTRSASQTPAQFAEIVLTRGGESFAPVGMLTRIFERVRYGEEELGPERRTEVDRLLGRLRQAARRRWRTSGCTACDST